MQLIIDDATIAVWPVAVALLLLVLWRKNPSFLYALCFVIFSIYLLIALDIAFFPIHISGVVADDLREMRRFAGFVNLIPFNFNFAEMPNLVWMQIAQNVLLTIPFGFAVSFVARLQPKDFRRLILVIGLGIEGIQLLISLLLRYPIRVIDVNDALLNTAGVLIGYGLFCLCAGLYLWLLRRFRLRPAGLAAYVHEVASRSMGSV